MSNSIEEWIKLPDDSKKNIFDEVSNKIGLPPYAIEKDWWVVHTLQLVFGLSCSQHLVFKGGTSLSKAWNIIKRFSEDVDLVLNREYLDFNGELSKSQVKKLREASCKFICEDFKNDLINSFHQYGLKEIDINVIERDANDTDPIKIEIAYNSITELNRYLKPSVRIEIGSRSLIEPFSNCSFSSFVGETYKGKPFADLQITIPVVNPERTLLEKIFLLHEEFQNQIVKIKVDHMSRHHYDIVKLMKTEFADKALNNTDLFNTIVKHRQQLYFLNYVDYSKHERGKLNIIPPNEAMGGWEKDYNEMKESMIYGDKPTFNELMEEIKIINTTLNEVTKKTE